MFYPLGKNSEKHYGRGGGGWQSYPLVPQRVNLFKLSHLQFTVNTLAATYLPGFFFLRLIREKVPDVDQPRRTRENKIVLTTGRHDLVKQVGDRTTALILTLNVSTQLVQCDLKAKYMLVYSLTVKILFNVTIEDITLVI